MSLRTVCSDPCLGSGQRNGSEQKWSGLTERVTLRVRVELLVYFLSHAQKSECKSLWLRRDAARPAIVIHTFTHSESGRWAWDLERVREKEREVKPEAPCWGVHLGMKRRSDLFRCEEGCVASPSHTHTHTHTHRHMILPLFPHPSMPHFTWTVSFQNLNALISSIQTYVFIVKDIIWHALKGIGYPKMKMLSSITQPCMTFFLSEFLLDTDWHN